MGDMIDRGAVLNIIAGEGLHILDKAIRALPAASSQPLASDARRALEADDVHGWINSLPAASSDKPGKEVMPVETNANRPSAAGPGVTAGAAPAEDVRARALKEAVDVDWASGRDVTDTAPEYLTDWQRGFVAGQTAMRTAIIALIPGAKP